MLSGLKFCLLFSLYHVHLSIFQVKSLEIQECTLVHKEANTGKHSAAATCLYRKYKQIHNLSLHFSYKNAKSVSRVLLYLEYSKVLIISSHFLSDHKQAVSFVATFFNEGELNTGQCKISGQWIYER